MAVIARWQPWPLAVAWTSRKGRALFLYLLNFVVHLQQRVSARSSPRGHQELSAGPQPASASVHAWLDGLRGVAALGVYCYHFTLTWYPGVALSYGASDNDRFFFQWPFVRILWSGRAAVTIFFVISGYVLSLRVLKLANGARYDDALESLAQAFFRRPFRLYMPVIAATFVIAFLSWCGLFPRQPGNINLPPIGPTLSEQLWHWFYATIYLVDPFRPIDGRKNMYSPPYNGHLWTIPTEMKGSLLVFTILLMLLRAKRWVRLVITFILGYWIMRNGDFDKALFIFGMLLADLSFSGDIRDQGLALRRIPTLGKLRVPGASFFLHSAVCVSAFLLGWFLLCYPDSRDMDTPYYRLFAQAAIVAPAYVENDYNRQFFWQSVGSLIFFSALAFSPPGRLFVNRSAPVDGEYQLRTPFASAFAQFLGRLSYPMYLLHGPINQTVSFRFFLPASEGLAKIVKRATELRNAGDLVLADRIMGYARNDYLAEYAIAAVVNTAILFAFSDVLWRLVDRHASPIGKYVTKHCWAKG